MGMSERRVEVEWLDSVSWSGWRSRSESTAKAKVDELRHRSCGYVLADNEAGLMLALTVSDYESDDDPQVADVQMIPRAVVGKVKELR